MTDIDFAKKHGITIPIRKWFEPYCIFRIRYINWREDMYYYRLLDNVITKAIFSQLSELIDWYNSYAEYLEYPKYEPELDYSIKLHDISDTQDYFIQQQEKFLKYQICILQVKAKKIFIQKAINNIPNDKNIIILKSNYTPDVVENALFKQHVNNLLLSENPGSEIPVVLKVGLMPVWVAFSKDNVPNFLKEPIFFGGNFNSIEVYYS